ncbi:MAG TPA: hypothetical protein VKE74_19400 [Gemmataceae bacterium]|nr:hypothetical protein [Gemmataceae bacterium]
MTRSLAAVAALGLLAGSLLAIDDPPPASADDITALVAQLGNVDFAKREAAEKALSAIGEPALPAIRAACASENPEVARRAERLVARITQRVENEKLLAPKFVTINAENLPLRNVLADLSAQSKYRVELGLETTGALPGKRVTVKTGRVPFWEAVLAICDAADLRIASVAGFIASDAPPAGHRASISDSGVMLEPRNGAKRRPAAVFGAVCVEAIPMPEATGIPDATTALLQVWPEPALNWQATTAVRVDRAADDGGQLLAADPTGPALQSPQVVHGNGVVVVKQVNGGVVVVNGGAKVPSSAATSPTFTPSTRQFVVRLRPGARPSGELSELSGALFGTVRVGPEPMVTLSKLTPGQSVEGSHPSGAHLKVLLNRDQGGKWRATVDLDYDTARVQMAESGGQLGNLINGIRVTDAAGNAYLTVPITMTQTARPVPPRMSIRMDCDLHPAKLQSGPPDAVTFWAMFGKPVDVPFALKGVPVVGGKR